MANLRVDKITSTETFETTGSVQFDGTDDGLTVSDHADFDLGTGDFTIEGWYYLENAGTYQSLMDWRGNSGTNGVYPAVFRNNTGDYIYYYVDGARRIDNIAISYGTWFHLTLCRSSGITRLFINGVEKGSFVDSFDYISREILLGISTSNANDLKGHISNYRVVKGKALYTENFTPPTRELTVTPETVLLACQHKTDASHEKTGKTITVTGNAVANELTPGLLTDVVKSGGNSAITGSVEFDGTGDYLTIGSSSDLVLGTSDFTVEAWINFGPDKSSQHQNIIAAGNPESANSFVIQIRSDSNNRILDFRTDTRSITTSTISTNEWNHIAVTKESDVVRLFVNGVQEGSGTESENLTTQISAIGYRTATSYGYVNGFISNLRIVKGTALYTDNFIPPTRELKKVPGTVLLCCQDENSVTTEATGKTITSNGDPAASNFTPRVGNDGSVEFVGPTKINSENYFYLPTGDTVTRDSRRGRGVQGAGYYYVSPSQTYVNTISYYEISTTGNALDFGDLKDTKGQIGSLGSATRGVFAGASQPAVSNAMDYITIASTGNALEFGDMTDTKWGSGGVANSTRGLFAGGRQPGWRASIDFITIASTGNAADFGDLSNGEQNHEMAAASSPTRGVFAGGSAPGSSPYFTDKIDFVTIQSTGNAQDFGDLSSVRKSCTGVASQTRMCVGGGLTPGLDQSIEYLTISSKGNSQTFGDLTGSEGRWGAGGTSNSIRGVFGGGYDPSPAASYNTMDYITIASTGDAQDFGDIGGANGINIATGLSDAHGGLG